ncbi:MAG: hypothetical protein COW30_12985 [Rhodospirillales bacterium CG15_BIG_FIL_POST_REV_8_21_14_020_66_15]|nr:MAG: hypothetical protein COW30_12985 [Rhodospirillales bacterium CG15_BIG_FIL_POST_REV_8_21_14_020_66_15]
MSVPRLTGEGRATALLVSVGAGVAVVFALHAALPPEFAQMIVGPPANFPFTIHAAEWLAFFVGLGELFVRLRSAGSELAELDRNYLPHDRQVALQIGKNLEDYYRRVRESETADVRFLPRLIQRIIRQYHGSRSIDQAHSLLNSSLELFMHEIDLRYSMLRYTAWVIPSLGFIGTVVGIAGALRKAGAIDPTQMADNILGRLTTDLGVAFDTTMLALALSMVLVFLMHLVQGREEAALNRIAQYCTDNLIIRFYKD